jgi:hypothetical protein
MLLASCFQYEQLNGGSEEKLKALREIKETVQHRKHLDSSIDFIGRLVFGFENGPKMLEAVRASGQPLVDDWDCLKKMVSMLTFRIHLCQKACMKFPFSRIFTIWRKENVFATCTLNIQAVSCTPVELISS